MKGFDHVTDPPAGWKALEAKPAQACPPTNSPKVFLGSDMFRLSSPPQLGFEKHKVRKPRLSSGNWDPHRKPTGSGSTNCPSKNLSTGAKLLCWARYQQVADL